MKKIYRSLLFVPGHKPDWAVKAPKFMPDGLILDLEDAVPWTQKDVARGHVSDVIESMRDWTGALFVRINPWSSGYAVKDVLGVLRDGLTGIMLPKVRSSKDIISLDHLLTELEIERGMPQGAVEIMPLWETPYAMMTIYDCVVASTRVRRCGGGFVHSPGGDRDRSLGLTNTEGRLEQLYLSAKAVLEAKAAGLDQVFGGMSTDLSNLAILQDVATRSRDFGCGGSMVIHPSHVAVVNEIFSPNQAAIDEAFALLEAMHAGVKQGDAAVRHNGKMVDIAMCRSSLELLEQTQRFGKEIRAIPSEWKSAFR